MKLQISCYFVAFMLILALFDSLYYENRLDTILEDVLKKFQVNFEF